MKNLIIIIVVAIFAICLSANAQTTDAKDQFTVKVDGLGCAFCAYGLEKKFKEIEEIKKIAINLETGTLTFLLASKSNFSLQDVATQVASAGYTFVNAQVQRASGTVEHFMQNETQSTQQNASNMAFEAIKVNGNCAMCKDTIEKTALNFDAVKIADWNMETKVLILEFDKNTVSLQEIEAAIAKAGYTTEHVKADANAYDNLPTCCKY